jgi:hypothetical protein
MANSTFRLTGMACWAVSPAYSDRREKRDFGRSGPGLERVEGDGYSDSESSVGTGRTPRCVLLHGKWRWGHAIRHQRKASYRDDSGTPFKGLEPGPPSSISDTITVDTHATSTCPCAKLRARYITNLRGGRGRQVHGGPGEGASRAAHGVRHSVSACRPGPSWCRPGP